MNRVYLVIALTMISLHLPTISHAGPMFVNGGFEADDWSGNEKAMPSGWNKSTPGTGNYPYGTNYYAISSDGYGPTPYGEQFVILGGSLDDASSRLGQEIDGFTVGQSYTLTFAMSAKLPDRENRPGAHMILSLTGASISSASFAEHMIDPNNLGNVWSQWHDHDLTFTATASAVEFVFQGDLSHGGSWEIGLDNFSLTENTVATPEPASLTLFSLGVLGLCAYRWRRQKENHTQP